MIARRAGVARVAGALVLLAACAQPTPPRGAPPDFDPPQLLGARPDSGSVRVRLDEVEFLFDEVISEQPAGATSLSRMVLVSPSDGEPDVRWRRSRLTVRPRDGWRPNTAYVVTLLAGIADLSGNRRDTATTVVFATGDSIPATRLSGALFDWGRGMHAPRALVIARPADDTTLAYLAQADSLGRFSLPFARPGSYVVRGVVDANNNREIDPRELWDSVLVDLRDTASVELYMFPHDSIAPLVSGLDLADSLTIRARLSLPLATTTVLDSIATILTPDSATVPIARVAPWPVLAEERAALARRRADSVAAVDTSEGARRNRERQVRDSINRAAAAADSAARDTVPRIEPPRPARPPLVSEIGIVLREPLPPAVAHRIRLRLTGLLGAERVVERSLTRPRPADSTAARRDTMNLRSPNYLP